MGRCRGATPPADNGIIGALRYDKLVRLDRRGRMLNQPVAAMGSDGPSNSPGIGGPYEPRISPDGKRFAYYYFWTRKLGSLYQW